MGHLFGACASILELKNNVFLIEMLYKKDWNKKEVKKLFR